MPELPEVETMRRGLLPVVGARIADVRRVPGRFKTLLVTPRIDAFRRRAVGQRITHAERIGKRVALRLETGAAILFEPRMTGLVLLADPPDNEHLRFHVTLSDAPVRSLFYWDRRGLGSVRLVMPNEWDPLLGPDRLGPDALHVDASRLRQRLARSRRAIKVALLDQRIVAGIGNIYASEILNVAGIHPARRCDRLTRRQWLRLQKAMRQVLEEAIRYEGSTLADGTYRNALNATGSYQNHHRVYNRADQTCRSCRQGTVVRLVQAQRSTFLCPHCQPPAS